MGSKRPPVHHNAVSCNDHSFWYPHFHHGAQEASKCIHYTEHFHMHVHLYLRDMGMFSRKGQNRIVLELHL